MDVGRPRERLGAAADVRAYPIASAHRGDRRGVILRAEDRRAGDERVRARRRDGADVVDLDAAVDLEPDRRVRCGR